MTTSVLIGAFSDRYFCNEKITLRPVLALLGSNSTNYSSYAVMNSFDLKFISYLILPYKMITVYSTLELSIHNTFSPSFNHVHLTKDPYGRWSFRI